MQIDNIQADKQGSVKLSTTTKSKKDLDQLEVKISQELQEGELIGEQSEHSTQKVDKENSVIEQEQSNEEITRLSNRQIPWKQSQVVIPSDIAETKQVIEYLKQAITLAEFIDNENVKSAYVKIQQDAIILRENELYIRHGVN